MRNRYPGTCYRCGKRVEKGEGHFELIHKKERVPGGPAWRTQHADCCIRAREEKAKEQSAPARCWNDYAKACKVCAEEGDDGIQRDDERERVKDMNAMLRCGRFYR